MPICEVRDDEVSYGAGAIASQGPKPPKVTARDAMTVLP
jgi:hypothetical protein